MCLCKYMYADGCVQGADEGKQGEACVMTDWIHLEVNACCVSSVEGIESVVVMRRKFF